MIPATALSRTRQGAGKPKTGARPMAAQAFDRTRHNRHPEAYRAVRAYRTSAIGKAGTCGEGRE
jgi:hypothetical protein